MTSKEVSITVIHPDPNQPRQSFPKETMMELKRSIKKQGILSPILVESNFKKDQYLILDGERRYRCALELNLEKVPVEIIQGPLSKAERTIKRFHVQEKRSEWSFFDRARAIYLFREDTNYTLAKIADLLELHLPRVHGLLSLMEFSKEGQRIIMDKKMPFNYASVLIRIVKKYKELLPEENQEEIEKKLITKVFKEKLTVSQLNTLAQIIIAQDNNRDKIKYLNVETLTLEDLTKQTKEGNKQYSENLFRFITQTNNSLEKFVKKELPIDDKVIKELSALEKLITKIKEIK